MTDTDTSALSEIIDAIGDLAAAGIATLGDGFQPTRDIPALMGNTYGFVNTVISKAGEAKREAADLDFDEGVDLATMLAGQAKKIKAALADVTSATA